MRFIYRNLFAAQNPPPSAAVHAARLSLLARRETSAPHFWAPLVPAGGWK